MKIKKVEAYEVNGTRFNSQKEAEKYVELKQKEDITLEENKHLLETNGSLTIPVYIREENSIDIFVKRRNAAGGNWEDWVSLIGDKELRYYGGESLQILQPDEFMEELRKCPSIYIGTNQWSDFIQGVININEKSKFPLDWREVIDMIGQMQVMPEYIYE
jgi:hypothetical protein